MRLLRSVKLLTQEKEEPIEEGERGRYRGTEREHEGDGARGRGVWRSKYDTMMLRRVVLEMERSVYEM